jgi:pyruvate/2-oxoglutarate/acetoin dehydrogenase E1 component
MTTVLEALNGALHLAMQEDKRVFVLGEDILDPYGGAFKVTRGLSDAYPERVIATPISEAGIVGLASGMALRGLRPVVEIMFGDFLTLAADQIINHAAKFRWMYNDQVRVPMVIRTPMGGRRGYGPTHSQSLEKHFLGVPGLRVLAPTCLGDPGKLLLSAIQYNQDPLLFIENKLLYLLHIIDEMTQNEFSIGNNQVSIDNSKFTIDNFILEINGAPPASLTIATYGYMGELARQAAVKLAYENEIFVELIVTTQLAPFQIDPILESAGRTGRLLAIEEGTLNLGWGAEIIARTAEALGAGLKAARRIGAQNLPIPASGPLEKAVLPGIDQIIQAAKVLAPIG